MGLPGKGKRVRVTRIEPVQPPEPVKVPEPVKEPVPERVPVKV